MTYLSIQGPEGAARHVFGEDIPCHYTVHTLGSPTSYQLTLPSGASFSGQGLSHMEGQYGTAFPRAWLWVQAVSKDGKKQLVFSSAEVPNGPLGFNWTVHVLTYRSPALASPWNFRNTELSSFSVERDWPHGALSVTVVSPARNYKLVVHVSAPREPDSYCEPLLFPTVEGFSNNPGCREAYVGTATVEVRFCICVASAPS